MSVKKKYLLFIIVAIIAIAVMLVYLLRDQGNNITADNDSDITGTEEIDPYADLDMDEIENGITFEEELEGAEFSSADANKEAFYGSWTATSGQSVFMYGNVDLTIKEDGSWYGNVAEEGVDGTWTYKDQSLYLTGEFFEVKLTFAEDGKLIMQEDREGDGDYINTVLSKAD